jgi:hypothetical protein
MKKAVIFIFVILTSLSITAQEKDFDYYSPEETTFKKPSDELKTTLAKPQPKIGFMTGASIGSFGGGNSFSNTFACPFLMYPVSSRLNLTAAAIFSNSQFSGMEGRMNPGGFNGRSFMVGLEYKITENLSIGGAIMHREGLMPDMFSPIMMGPSPRNHSFFGW